MDTDDQKPEGKMDSKGLFREDVITDRRVGSIRVLTPVNPDGTENTTREVVFVGQAQMLTPMGAIPLNFEIEADTLAVAIEKFSTAANAALEKTAKELEEMRREQASSIVVPGANGMPRGGKIQLK